IILSIISLSFSIENFKSRFLKKSWNVRFNPKSDIVFLLLLFILFGIGAVIETYISPNLIRLVITKFYQ
ncbi:MAG: stage II sporulation protein M, partial [Clostridium sp.]|nr:stage II sporulation protein M [Clostridium sp.]